MQIVIVDDSLTVRMTLEALLEDLGVGEAEIFSFEDAYAALLHVEEKGADLVFTDMYMPGLGGYEFVRKLLAFRPDLRNRLWVISGEEDKNAVFKMKEVGASRFIKKPLDIDYFSHFVEPDIQRIRAKEMMDGCMD